MGCTVSKKSLEGSEVAAPPFIDANASDDDDDESHNGGDGVQIDRTAIEVLSHFKGEQSLLALAMNAKPGGDEHTTTATSSIRLSALARAAPKSSDRPVSEASPRERATRDADGIAATSVTGATALNPITSPIKIRIQEPQSSVITSEEHEHSKLLPDLQYSMRAAPTPGSAGAQFSHLEWNLPTAEAGPFGAAAGYLQPFNGARKLQPITAAAHAMASDPHALDQHAVAFPQRHLQKMPLTGLIPPDRMHFAGAHQQSIGAGRGPVLGGGDAMGSRGRVVPSAVVGRGGGLAGPMSPLFRGPVQGAVHAGAAGRGGGAVAIAVGPRGIPRPLHAVVVRPGGGSQRQSEAEQAPSLQLQPRGSPHASATSSEFVPPSAVKRSADEDSAVDIDDDDDDDDLVADDDEVEDWDLDDEVEDWDLDDESSAEEPPKSQSKPPSQRDVSPSKTALLVSNSLSPSEGSTLFKKQPPEPIQTSSTARGTPLNPPPLAQKAPRFRPTHGAANDLVDIGASAAVVDEGSSNDDDDDDSNFGDDNEDVEDWFDDDSTANSASPSMKGVSAKANKAGVTPSHRPQKAAEASSPLRSVPRSPAMHMPPASSSPAMTPTFRHPHSASSEALKASPHPPPMQRLPSRQIVTPGGGISTSPTKPPSVGSPTVGSPLKQASYRSSIVSTGQSVLIPMAGTTSAAAVGSAPIRDTKVVKKKRAELPQRNLPHPTPKFGDWLNSRTMINNYIILEALGSGSYAEVKLCKEKVSGKLFAMKFINRDIMKKDKLGKQSKLDDIKREIAIMKKLNHPNVLRLYEVMDDPSMNKLFLVLEYMKHGDLLSHQKKKHASSTSIGGGGGGGGEGQDAMESLHDRDLHCVFLQVVLGLAYLHEQKIVHGDIKPQNILVGDKDAVKIADFGISQSLYGSKQKLSDTAGTPAFMSPEMCSGEEYSGQMADIWAVGATFFMLKFGNPPFVAKSAMQMFEKIQSDPLVFPFAIDPLLQNLLSGMMVKDPQQRMTLLEVMSHPWVTKEETLSNYSVRQDAPPRITVSTDDIEHAIHSKDQFAIIVNIRIQMMKNLQRTRQEMLERQRRLHADGAERSSGFQVPGGTPVQVPPIEVSSAASTATALSEEHKKAVKLKSPKLKQNKIHADHHSPTGKAQLLSSSPGGDKVAERNPPHHEMLSSEEINYRAQLFSRKKTGSSAVPASGKSRDQGACGFETEADSGSASGGTDEDGDDDDVLSSSDDDETAVAQSPQLLDELLLTTLSMPPLTKSKSSGEAARDSTDSDPAHALQSEAAHIQQQSHAPSTMTGDMDGYCGESSMLSLRFGVSSLQGRRSTQEDRWVVLPEISGDVAPAWSKSAFVGLFDGHGGEECSHILHEQLHAWLFRDPHDLELTPAVLQTRFEELDTYVCDYLLQKGDLSGSTATCVILRPAPPGGGDSGKIQAIVAHVGDCRLVLSLRSNEVQDITQDHRLSVCSERDRIVECGGRVVNNRVNGVMAITRAFGDLEFKGLLGKKFGASSSSSMSMSSSSSLSTMAIPSAVQQNPFQKDDEKIPALLTARPDVHVLELDPSVHEFLLLACDGLWDVMTSDEAAEIFRDRLYFHGNLQLAAKELAQEAIRRYSNDNITVVAIQVGVVGGVGGGVR